MGRTAIFWNRIAARYARTPITNEAAYGKKLELTQQYLRPDMRLLELGCGTGSTAITHAPYVEHIEAVDFSPRMLEIARGRAQRSGVTNITFTQSAIVDLDAGGRRFDMVLALSILHLVEDRRETIAQAHDLLVPGGLLVSSTACIGDWMRWFRFVAPILRVMPFMPLVRVFTSDEFRADLAEAGFAIEYDWQPGPREAVFLIARKPG